MITRSFSIASLAAVLCFSAACDPAKADADADGVQASLDCDDNDPLLGSSFTDGDCCLLYTSDAADE